MSFQSFRQSYALFCDQLSIAPLYELSEDQIVEAAILRTGDCNLQGCSITSSDVIALAQTLKYEPIIRSIDLRSNALDDMAALALAEAIATTGFPLSVDFRNNNLTDTGAQALLDTARQVKQVQSILLDNNQISPALLAQMQALMVQRKLGAAATAPASASSAAVREPLRSARSDRSDRQDDLDMDLGFDSEIRPQRDSPSQSMLSSPALQQKQTKSPSSVAEEDAVSPLAPAAAASSTMNGGGSSARRSSFSEALRSAGHDTDFGDSFDWDKADTNDLLDSGAPASSSAAAAPAVPVFAPAATPAIDFAPLSAENEGPPPPVAAYRPPAAAAASHSPPSLSQGLPSVARAESLSSKSTPQSTVAAMETPIVPVTLPPPAAASSVAAAPASVPSPVPAAAPAAASSGHLDDLDDFNFDDSHVDALESSVRSADPTPIKPHAPAPAAVAPAPAAANAAPSSSSSSSAAAAPRRPSLVSSFPPTPHDNDPPQQHARDHSVDAQDAWSHKSAAAAATAGGSPQRSRVSSPRSVIHPPPSKQPAVAAVSAAPSEEEVKSPSSAFAAAAHARSASGPESPQPSYQASTQSSQAQQQHQSHMRSASAYYPHQSTSPSSNTSNAAAPVVAARPTLLPPDPSELSTDPLDSAAYRTTFTREMLAPSPSESLGPALSIFHSLRALNLPNLGLTSLPLLPRTLESLSVPQNALGSAALGARVAPLKFLRELDARQCGLQETQGIMGSVHPLLRTLLLSGNALKSLTGFAHLRSLSVLDVRQNALASLAALRELSMNPALKVLRLSANPLSTAGALADPKALRTKVLSIVPHIAQLDNHVLALGPIAPKAGTPGPEVSMLLEADALDTADLVAALVQFHLPGFKRLFAKLAGEKEDASASATAASQTLPLQGLFTHLQSLGFLPFFLLEPDAKTLLSLLAGSASYAPGSLAPSSYTPSSSRIGVHEFVEFVARACIAKSERMNHSQAVGATAAATQQPMPPVLKSYAKALRALGSDGGSLQHVSPFDEPFLRALFFSPPSADNPHAHHPWLYANYAVKLLGLLGKPKAPAAPSMMSNIQGFNSSSNNESYMRNTSSASSRQAEQQQQASPPHSRNVSQTAAQNAASAAASSGAASKKRAPSPSPAVPARKQSPAPSAAVTSKVSERLYTPAAAKPAPPATVKFAAAVGSMKKKPPLAPRPVVAAAPAVAAPTSASPELDLPLDHDDPSNESHDDSHYLPAASTAAAANVLSGLAGIENTLSPHQGRLPLRGNGTSSSRKPIITSGMTLQQRAAAAAAAAYEEEMSNGLQGLSIDAGEEEDDPLSLTAGKGATAPPGRRAPPAAGPSATSPSSAEREADDAKLSSGGAGGGGGMEDDSWLDEVDVSTARGIKTIIHNLNAKISKLYSWHLAEIDLVSRQQMQLNSLQSELDVAKSASTAAGSLSNTNASPSPNQSKRPSISMGTGALSFEALSPGPAMHVPPQMNQTVAASRTPLHNPSFSPQAQQQQQHLSRSMPVQSAAPAGLHSAAPPASNAGQASSDDWTALLHALAVLEQTDPNCAEVQMLRQLIAQEQAQPHPQPLSAYAQQPAAPVQQPRQAVPQPVQFQAQPNQPFHPHQQQPQQMQFQQTPLQQPLAQTQPLQHLPQQQHPHLLASSPSPPPLSMTLPSPAPAAAPLAVGSGVSASVVLSSFWVPSVRDWCLELDEELKTATMALANLLEITDVAPISEEAEQQQQQGQGQSQEISWYRTQVAEFEQILSVSAMLVPFGLPSHVAAQLSALPAELLAAIRASAHRLEATKKSLHSFLALVHTQAPNSALVRELRATILASGVTQLPAPTLEQLASSISHRAVQASAVASMQQQQQQQQQQSAPLSHFSGAQLHPQPQPQQFAGPPLIRPVAQLFTPIHPQPHAPHQPPPSQTQSHQQQQHQPQPPPPFYSMTPSPTLGANVPSPRNAGPVATPGHMRSHTIHANPRRWQ